MGQRIYVSLTVSSDDQNSVTRAIEAMSRTAAGLALEGVFASLSIGPYEEVEDDA